MTFFDRRDIEKSYICRAMCTISMLAFILSVGLQVYFSNTSAIKSNEMVSLKERRAGLEGEILALSQEITTVSCLSNIEETALKKGFVSMEAPLLVVKTPAVALAR